MQSLINAIQSEDLAALEQAYNQCDHNRIQIEGACIFSLTPEADPPQFSGAHAETETYDYMEDGSPVRIGPSYASGEICKFLSKNVSNPDSFAKSYAAAQMFGSGGEVEGLYALEEWNVDENGKHTSLKSSRLISTMLENENVDPNRRYKRNYLSPGLADACRI